MQQLTVWDNFYVLIGTAAATLTGLLFVVVALIVQRQVRANSEAFAAYNTPSIVHLCSALGIAAMLCAPWPLLWQPDLLLGLAGLAGTAYSLFVMRRLRRQGDYRPVLEDWLWHTLFPLLAYAALILAALFFVASATPALFIAGAATLLLLFIGIHNAWDNVIYLVFYRPAPEQNDQDAAREAEARKQPAPAAD
jgi:hypothetical protein